MIEKSCNINIPRTVPPKRERRTFFVYIATKIASRDGINDKKESSI